MSQQPPDPLDRKPVLFPVALAALALVALIMALAKVQVGQLEDELRIARRRRDELEAEVAKKTEQVDGALATITRLRNDAEPEPEREPAGE